MANQNVRDKVDHQFKMLGGVGIGLFVFIVSVKGCRKDKPTDELLVPDGPPSSSFRWNSLEKDRIEDSDPPQNFIFYEPEYSISDSDLEVLERLVYESKSTPCSGKAKNSVDEK